MTELLLSDAVDPSIHSARFDDIAFDATRWSAAAKVPAAARVHVAVGVSSPALLYGLQSLIGDSNEMQLDASAQSLAEFLSVCTQMGSGVALVDPSIGRQSMRDFMESCRLAAPNVRLVLMTDSHQPHIVREALRVGACGFVDRTADADTIRTAIAAAARGQRYISPAIAVQLAESLTLEELTNREMQVLRLLSQGDCNKTIARRLDVTVGTVKTHVRAVMGKLESRSRTEAVLKAFRLGLVGFEH